MSLGESEDSLSDVRGRLVATRSKAGPVVEVDDADSAVGIHDAVTTVDNDIQFFGSLGADVLEFLQVDVNALTMAINLFPAILAVYSCNTS